MLFSNVLAASVLAFTASAAPALLLAARAPQPSTSTGIRLVVEPSGADFPDGSVKGLEITIAHTGPGLNRAIATAGKGAIFYSNGTDAQAQSWTAHLMSDTPTYPHGFVIMYESFNGPEGVQFEVEISAKQDATRAPSDGMQVSRTGTAFLDPAGASGSAAADFSFIICKDTIPYYGDAQIFNTLNWLISSEIPESCVAVRLIPECDTLADLAVGAAWNHDYARTSRCYPDVQSITSFE